MLVKIEGNNDPIKISELKEIGKGKDGRVLEFGNDVLKICDSGYMTIPKLKDLRSSVPTDDKTKIIVPKKIAYNPYKEYIFDDESVTGYTQKRLHEQKDGILRMTTSDYLEEAEKLKSQIHEFFTRNCIAITDTNPRNILSAESDGQISLYLIDQDRTITPNSEHVMKRCLIKNDYASFNEKRASLMLLKVMLLQLQLIEGLTNDSISPINSYIDELLESPNLNGERATRLMEKTLKRYKTMSEYAIETTASIKAQRK